jgi:hypothetical protein
MYSLLRAQLVIALFLLPCDIFATGLGVSVTVENGCSASQSGTQGTVSASCSAGNIEGYPASGSASATASVGYLTGSASGSIFPAYQFFGGYLQNEAYAVYLDDLVAQGSQTPAFISATATISGQGGDYAFADAEGMLTLYLNLVESVALVFNGSESVTTTIPYSPNVALNMQLQVYAQEFWGGSASGSFAVSLTSLEALDENMNPLPGVSIVTESSLPGNTEVPEQNTVWLVLACVPGLLLFLHRECRAQRRIASKPGAIAFRHLPEICVRRAQSGNAPWSPNTR